MKKTQNLHIFYKKRTQIDDILNINRNNGKIREESRCDMNINM